MKYDCIIVGGGIAGLQAAIQLGRYKHKILVIDSNNGRSNLCHCYHNILGWPDGVDGQKLRDIGKKQAEGFGVVFIQDEIVDAKQINEEFSLIGKQGVTYQGRLLLLATGVMDRFPYFSNLYPCLGNSIYICPDCDGYEINNKRAIVLGSGDVGANMALTLTYWSQDLVYVNHEQKKMADRTRKELEKNNIVYAEEPIKKVVADGSQFKGVKLESGSSIHADHAFLAFGGNKVRSDLAAMLGVDLYNNNHILVDPRTKMTNVENVWAAGDVVAHSEQTTIAMGDGMQAAIWMHKYLMGDGPSEL
ncbi:NAD(P)/FAD-dependent oxidoreductase [Aquibacillus sp. 3ASR75-11]|uniref:NAD(P)/FAD-dependent oxidoreductase n=1 Tax=Terrihalobacillus insolitus TaxID=2950438 RepID=A0A9X4ANE8_9BACI|nr:NAD(P)/FAD-dependent oxidoreductase [Terrihalobacillus insolitus]MDC3424465.1 NAD(P)/FAD-dependent oxidoreductase [Terrihalobacillus insolitus]